MEGCQSQRPGSRHGALQGGAGVDQRKLHDGGPAAMTRGLIALAFAGLSHAALAQPADESIAQMQSCLREEGAARQQCIDQLWWELTGDKAPTGPTRSPGGSWVISETQSPVDYSQQISAANLSHAGGENVPTTLTIH